jgi:hypothetical protein
MYPDSGVRIKVEQEARASRGADLWRDSAGDASWLSLTRSQLELNVS